MAAVIIVIISTGIYLLKVSNENNRRRLLIWRRSDICVINFEHISRLVKVFLLLNFNR